MELKLATLNLIWGEASPSRAKAQLQKIGQVFIDSRKVKPGSFFVPLVGDNFDGHAFLNQAYEKGAQATVVAKTSKYAVPHGLLHWVVDDTLVAFQQLAQLHRDFLAVPVIAVTGSVGKTTTRELIRSAISPLGRILASNNNNNNDVGVALTLLRGERSHAAIVVEMGMRGLGEISRLSACAKPDIAVITNVGTAHLGRLGSRENIAKAKCEITSFLKPTGSVVIPYGDKLIEEVLPQFWKGRIIRVGVNNISKDSKLSNDSLNTVGISVDADFCGYVDLDKRILSLNDYHFELPLEGIHNAKNLMLALAVASELGVPYKQINSLNVELPSGRSNCLQIGDVTVLDETYNASPESTSASLDLLVSKPGRHFAVLGSMLELGDQSMDLHLEIAKKMLRLGIDGLILVGENAEINAMAKVLEELPRLAVVASPKQASSLLNQWIRPGDILLLKGSRSVGLEALLPLIQELFQ